MDSLTDRCSQCPLFLRVTDSCPRYPQYLVPYVLMDDSDVMSIISENIMVMCSFITNFIFVIHFLIYINNKSRHYIRIIVLLFF
jgi:hypothetical protein